MKVLDMIKAQALEELQQMAFDSVPSVEAVGETIKSYGGVELFQSLDIQFLWGSFLVKSITGRAVAR